MNKSFSKEWDRQLNELLTRHTFVGRLLDEKVYVITFDEGTKVWVSNYPYAYGYNCRTEVRPSRLTILRLRMIMRNTKFE